MAGARRRRFDGSSAGVNGYDIIADVGNNTGDLTVGYADTTYRFPDCDGLLG